MIEEEYKKLKKEKEENNKVEVYGYNIWRELEIEEVVV